MDIIKKIKAPLAFLFFTSVLLVFLLTTKPSEDNFSLSLMPLLLLWFVVYYFFRMIVKYIFVKSKPKSQKILSTIVATMVATVVMFSALGQLAVFDFVLLLMLVVLGAFYFSRTWPK